MSGAGWTEERMCQLRDLWAEGLSMSEIGLRLGVTRGVVAGKAHRMGLSSRVSPITGQLGQRKPRPSRAVRKARPAPAVVPVIVPIGKRLPCCWPEGEPGTPGFRYCGAPREVRSDGRQRSYCPEHAARAYARPEQVAG